MCCKSCGMTSYPIMNCNLVEESPYHHCNSKIELRLTVLCIQIANFIPFIDPSEFFMIGNHVTSAAHGIVVMNVSTTRVCVIGC